MSIKPRNAVNGNLNIIVFDVALTVGIQVILNITCTLYKRDGDGGVTFWGGEKSFPQFDR